jgi:serine/threonine protein phosphatase 1
MGFPKLNKLMPSRKEDTKRLSVTVDVAAVPKDICIYAIGDIHGRNDLLIPLLDRIAEDTQKRKVSEFQLVFLGDYVDRGPDSCAVVETILEIKLPKTTVIALNGNHEVSMLSFLDDPLKGKRWLHYGGDATLRSYGITVSACDLEGQDIVEIGERFRQTLPGKHRTFFEGLSESYAVGDYFFAHAGVDPTLSLENQKEEDLLWIRDNFLLHEQAYEKVIIHGHSITPSPEFKSNRIGIDTGAFYSDKLTCLVLEGDDKQIL